jgi:uncharacterized membrane protein
LANCIGLIVGFIILCFGTRVFMNAARTKKEINTATLCIGLIAIIFGLYVVQDAIATVQMLNNVRTGIGGWR